MGRLDSGIKIWDSWIFVSRWSTFWGFLGHWSARWKRRVWHGLIGKIDWHGSRSPLTWAILGRQGWCIFLLDEELKNTRILKITGWPDIYQMLGQLQLGFWIERSMLCPWWRWKIDGGWEKNSHLHSVGSYFTVGLMRMSTKINDTNGELLENSEMVNCWSKPFWILVHLNFGDLSTSPQQQKKNMEFASISLKKP